MRRGSLTGKRKQLSKALLTFLEKLLSVTTTPASSASRIPHGAISRVWCAVRAVIPRPMRGVSTSEVSSSTTRGLATSRHHRTMSESRSTSGPSLEYRPGAMAAVACC
jgi:hypothetical protein